MTTVHSPYEVAVNIPVLAWNCNSTWQGVDGNIKYMMLIIVRTTTITAVRSFI